MNQMKIISATLLILLTQLFFTSVPTAHAATSPTLGDASSYSILAGSIVTNTGPTTTSGDVGVSPSIGDPPHVTDFPPGIVNPPGAIHDADANAALAQADNTAAFGVLDQVCDTTYAGTKDLVGLTLSPGVYCADAFELSGTLNLSGSGAWIFKSAATLTTSGTANIVGGDPCNVWWRVVSSATLGTNTSLIGNILASTSISLATGADLFGRALAQTGAVTLDTNTVSGPICTVSTPASTSATSSTSGEDICIAPSDTIVTPIIIEVKRVSPTSVYLSWGPYSGTDTFNVRYGLENGTWLYNTDVTGFNTTINDLPPNQPIWFQVAARNNCAIGDYGEPKQTVGGVLAASTTTLAATGSNNQFIRIVMSIATTLLVFFLGKSFLLSNETS